jgi:hypothetical protein
VVTTVRLGPNALTTASTASVPICVGTCSTASPSSSARSRDSFIFKVIANPPPPNDDTSPQKVGCVRSLFSQEPFVPSTLASASSVISRTVREQGHVTRCHLPPSWPAPIVTFTVSTAGRMAVSVGSDTVTAGRDAVGQVASGRPGGWSRRRFGAISADWRTGRARTPVRLMGRQGLAANPGSQPSMRQGDGAARVQAGMWTRRPTASGAQLVGGEYVRGLRDFPRGPGAAGAGPSGAGRGGGPSPWSRRHL